MTVLYICSNESYAGKSLASLLLGRRCQEMGLKVGYFKPVGGMPTRAGGVTGDEDTLFIAKCLDLKEPPEVLCPVLLTPESMHKVFAGETPDFMDQIDKAFATVSKDKDLLLIGGLGSVCCTGLSIGINQKDLVDRLGAKALLISKFTDDRSVDMILASRLMLADRLIGTVINNAPRNQYDRIRDEIAPFLEKNNLPVFGILPHDQLLSSMSVNELAEAIHARILCCEGGMEELVEQYTVGAMNVESALQYFRRIPNKAVITGGDRSDIQLAALETSTRCLILTGDLAPHPRILTKAEESNVPILLTRQDTLSTVEHIERMLGKLRVREPQKIARAVELAREHVDFERLSKTLGLCK